MTSANDAVTPFDDALDADQDSAWKEMLEAYLPAFLEFFFPHIYVDVDWSRGYESLDKELAEIRPTEFRSRLLADKLFRVWLNNGRQMWLLIHIEVQGRGGPRFTRRVFVYNYRLMDTKKAEVISLAVLTDAKPGNTGRYETGRWGCTHVFEFPSVRITDYRKRWHELEQSHNVFALVVMAQLKAHETKGHNQQQRYAWKRHLVFSLYERGYKREQIVNLFRFMDWVMRLPVDLEEELKEEVYQAKERRMPYISTIERLAIKEGLEKGMQQGIQQGMQQGIERGMQRGMKQGLQRGKKQGLQQGLQRGKKQGLQQGLQQGLLNSLSLQLSHRLGDLNATTQAKLKKLSEKQMQQLSLALFDFKSKADLTAWLKRHVTKKTATRKRK